LCDNLQALTTKAALDQANLDPGARLNHAFAHTALKPLLPALLLGRQVTKLLHGVLDLIVKRNHVHKEGQSKARKPGVKPHKPMTQKCC
ncbi:IS4 family transposase, partial [Roseateles sp. GG27B]